MDTQSTLAALGWTPELGAAREKSNTAGASPARVIAEHRGAYVIRGESGEARASVRGRLRDAGAITAGSLPAVGDWVLASELSLGVAMVEELLPRRTAVRRKTVLDRSDEQLLASNVDTIFVVSDLVHDLNARRLERYLTIAWDSGADPVIVLTKLDLCDDRLSLLEAESVGIGVPLVAVSGVTGEGFDALGAHLAPARTVALIGSSGVGKSTIVNRLLGEERLATGVTRQDGRGRHVTRHRELYSLPGGALVIDTPGMRELQLWEGDIDDAFPDITELAAACRFTDCAHDEEPGCAVREAVDPARMESYRRLQRELAATEARRSNRLRRELKQRWKQRTRESRQARRHGRL